jgi:hypothetical protein
LVVTTPAITVCDTLKLQRVRAPGFRRFTKVSGVIAAIGSSTISHVGNMIEPATRKTLVRRTDAPSKIERIGK